MKSSRLFPFALALVALTAWSQAAQPDEHSGHHPAGAAAAAVTKPVPATPGAELAGMDAQTAAMTQMHEKMMSAKTPEERNALMSEHMKTMQDGMTMMNGMSPQGMGGKKAGKGDVAARNAMMEKHVAMMGAAMQMMADRLPTPAK